MNQERIKSVAILESRLNRIIKLLTILCEMQLDDKLELMTKRDKYKKRLKYVGLK